MVETLDSKLSSLSDLADGSLKALSEKMFEKGLITEQIKNKPESYNIVIDHFKSHIRLLADNKTRNEVDDIVELFLVILEEFCGGPLKTAAEIIRDSIENRVRTATCSSKQTSMPPPPQATTVRDMVSYNFPLSDSNMSDVGTFKDDAGGRKSPVTETTRERSVDVNTSGTDVELYDVKPGTVEDETDSSSTRLVLPSGNGNETRPSTLQQPSSCVRDSFDMPKKEVPVTPTSLEETAIKGNHVPSERTDHSRPGIQAGGNSSTSIPSIQGYTQLSAQQQALTAYNTNEMKKLLEEKNKLMEEKNKLMEEKNERIRELEKKNTKMESEREDKIKQEQEKIRKDKECLEEREKRQDKEFEECKKKLKKEFDERKKRLDEWEKKLEKDNEQLRNTRKGINRDSEKQRKQMERGISVEKQRMRREISDEKKTMEQDIETRRRSLTDDESFLLVKRKELDSWEARLNDKESNFDREKKRVILKDKEANEQMQNLNERMDDFEKDKKLQEEAIKKEEKKANISRQNAIDKWEGYWVEDAILRQRIKEIERKEAKQKEKKINQLLDIKTYIMLGVIVFLILLWICTIAIVYYKFYNFL